MVTRRNPGITNRLTNQIISHFEKKKKPSYLIVYIKLNEFNQIMLCNTYIYTLHTLHVLLDLVNVTMLLILE